MKFGLAISGMKGLQVLKKTCKQLQVSTIFCYERTDIEGAQNDEIIRLAKQLGIELLIKKRLEIEDFKALDCVFVVGWQYLFEINEKVIVFHDSLLPRYRGFNPTVSALINAEKTIGVTAFFPNDRVDAGNIIGSKAVELTYPIKLYDALLMQSDLTAELVLEIAHSADHKGLNYLTQHARPQDERLASYSIWRKKQDHILDWGRDAVYLQRFINAVGNPYAGAITRLDQEELYITECELVDDLNFEIRDAGKIWSLTNNQPEVVCGQGMLRILKAETISGETYTFSKLKARFS